MTRVKLSIAVLILVFGISFGSQIWIKSKSSGITAIAAQTEKMRRQSPFGCEVSKALPEHDSAH